MPAKPDVKLRLIFDGLTFGPGKADLLDGIARSGSISAAGRAMGMSYKRAWMLVEEMNAAFRAPLVSSNRGGPGGGGAQLTDTGAEVLRLYRAAYAEASRASADPAARIAALMRGPGRGPGRADMSDGK